MLPTLRRNVRRLSWTLWLVILAFIVLYIPDLVRPQENVIARVDGDPIYVNEYRRSLQSQMDYYRSLSQGEMPEDFFDQIKLDQIVLKQLVQQRLLLAAALDQGLDISPTEVRSRILQYEIFRNENGLFVGMERYREILGQNSLDPESFEAQLIEELVISRLTGMLGAGITVTDSELEEVFQRQHEKIRFNFMLIRPGAFELEVAEGLSDEEAEVLFQENPESYRLAEQRRISYVLVDTEAIRDSIDLGDKRPRAYYDGNIAEFTVEEQAKARHILFRVPPGSGDGDKAAQRAKAEAVLARLRAGEDIAQLAAEYSDDSSASAGGDLGWFSRGRNVEAFDKVAFSLLEGELSEVVETEFGFHIIKVEGRRAAEVQRFEDVRGQIEQRLAWEEAEQRADETAAELRREVLRGRGLDDLASEFDLKVQPTPLFTQASGWPELGSAELTERVFTLTEGRVTEPLRVRRGYAVFRVDETVAPYRPAFEEVVERVRADLIDLRAAERSAAVAREFSGRLVQGESLDNLATEASTTVQSTELITRDGIVAQIGRNAKVLQAAFEKQTGQAGGPVEVSGSYLLFRILDHQQPDWSLFATQRDELQQQELVSRRNRILEAYLAALEEKYSVMIYDEVIQRVTG